MAFLLDTNAVIGVLKDPAAPIGQRLRRCQPEEVFISAIVLHELFYGAFRSARVERNLAVVEGLRFSVLEFSREDARAAGKIRAALVAQGKPIGPYDVLIAGQAVARGLVLVTRNGAEFGRVKGLVMEDWEAG
jgi:tRNA(fMet)-specific endonuclease VapC